MKHLIVFLVLLITIFANEDGYSPTFENVSYGVDERNVFDFWSIEGAEAVPLLIYMHGGGFIAGDKSSAKTDPILRQCIENNIAVMSINYRFVTSSPYPAPMLDGKRALQFIRFHAQKFNIDKNRIALMGYSAGALISLWIGLQNDMADPLDEDPVLRESTRVQFIVPKQAPTSSDPVWIWENIGGNKNIYPSLLDFYNIESLADIYKPEIRKMAYEASPINFVSMDDPPVAIYYHGELTATPLPADTPFNTSIHHPQFGILLQQKMQPLGLKCDVYYRNSSQKKSIISFLQEIFLKFDK